MQAPPTYKAAATSVKCSACAATISTAFLHCHRCGAANQHYDEVSAITAGHIPRKRQKVEVNSPAAVQDIEAGYSPGKQAEMKKWMGDLVKFMRNQENASATALASVEDEALAAIAAAADGVAELAGEHTAPPALAAAAELPPPSVPAATPKKKLLGTAADKAAFALATEAATPPPSVAAATPQPECPGTGAAVLEAAPIVPAQRVWSKAELGQGAAAPNSKVLVQSRKRFLHCLHVHALSLGQIDPFADEASAGEFAERWSVYTGVKFKVAVGSQVINDVNGLLALFRKEGCPANRYARWVAGRLKEMPEPDLCFGSPDILLASITKTS